MSKNILLVDDDEEILYCYQMLLENDQIELFSAVNAEDALDILREVNIDVAILDYMLPTCKGDRLAQLINESYPGVVIFIVSGIYDVEEALASMDVHVKEVFKKPLDPDMLEDLIMTECRIAH